MNRNGRGESWSAKEHALLRKMYAAVPLADIAHALHRTIPGVKSRAKLLKLRRARYQRKRWTAREDRLLRKLYPTTITSELVGRFGCAKHQIFGRAKRLGLSKTPQHVAAVQQMLSRKLRENGKSYRFPKGHTPQNKGLRRPGWFAGRMRETQFKPGQNTGMPIGSTRLVDGYEYTKVAAVKYVAYTVNWKPSHFLLWERVHGPIPKGHKLRFRDGNRLHIALENLELVSDAEMMRRNTIHNQDKFPPELKQVIQLTGVLNRQVRRRSGKKQDVGSSGSSVRNSRAAEGPGEAARG